MSDETWLVVGLGNPAPTYAHTRHNVGYLVADELVSRMGAKLKAHKSGRAEVAEGRLAPPGIPAPTVVVMRARTYMNESGGPVATVAKFYGVPAERVIVVYDELDLPFTSLRAKIGGGDNGHNGVKSVRASLGTGEFYRVRVGIGRPPGRQEVHDFVLSNWSAAERKELPFHVIEAADAVDSLIARGLEQTQQEFNS